MELPKALAARARPSLILMYEQMTKASAGTGLTLPDLAASLRMSDATVRRGVRELEELGVVRVERQTHKTGACLPTLVFLVAPPARPAPPRAAVPPSKPSPPPPAVVTPPPSPAPVDPVNGVLFPELVPPAPPPKPDPMVGFELWYAHYPKKKSRQHAAKAWVQTERHRPPLEKLIAITDRWAKSYDWRRDGGAWIPYPATWLRAHGWLDDAPSLRPQQQKAATAPRKVEGLDQERRRGLAAVGQTWNHEEES